MTSTAVFSAGFLSQTTTEITVPAGTLVSGQPFGYELIFSNRLITDSAGSQFGALLNSELRTSGTFETASAQVPEPGSWVPLTSGACLALLRRRCRH